MLPPRTDAHHPTTTIVIVSAEKGKEIVLATGSGAIGKGCPAMFAVLPQGFESKMKCLTITFAGPVHPIENACHSGNQTQPRAKGQPNGTSKRRGNEKVWHSPHPDGMYSPEGLPYHKSRIQLPHPGFNLSSGNFGVKIIGTADNADPALKGLTQYRGNAAVTTPSHSMNV